MNDAQMKLAVLFTAKVQDSAFTQAVKELRQRLDEVNSVLKGMGVSSKLVDQPLKSTAKTVSNTSASAQNLAKDFDDLLRRFPQASKLFERLTGHTQGMQQAFVKAAKGMTDFSAIQNLYTQFSRIEKSLFNQAKRAGLVGDAYKKVITSQRMLSEHTRLINSHFLKYENNFKKYNESVRKEALKTWKGLQNLPNMRDPQVLYEASMRKMSRYLAQTGEKTQAEMLKQQRVANEKAAINFRKQEEAVANHIKTQAIQYGKLGPVFGRLSQQYRESIINKEQYNKQLAKESSLFDKSANANQRHVDFLNKQRLAYRELIPRINEVNQAGLKQGATYQTIQSDINKLVKAHVAHGKEMADSEKWISRIEAKYTSAFPNMVRVAKTEQQKVISGEQSLVDAQRNFGKIFTKNKIATEMAKNVAYAKRFYGEIKNLSRAINEYTRTGDLKTFNKELSNGLKEYNKQQKAVQDLRQFYKGLVKEAKQYPDALKSLRQVGRDARAGVTPLGEAKELAKGVTAIEKSISSMRSKWQEVIPKDEFSRLNKELRSNGAKAITEYESKVSNLGRAFNSLQTVAAKAGGRFESLKPAIQNILTSVQPTIQSAREAEGAIKGLVDAHQKQIKVLEQTKRPGNMFTWWMGDLISKARILADYAISGGFIYGIFRGLKAGNTEIIQFSQTLKNLQAITGATDAQITVMGEKLKDVARETRFSTGELGKAMTLLGQAGFDAGESLKGIDTVAKLSTGTLTDMGTSIDLLTTVLRAFNLDASQFGRAGDVMANAINKSKLTVDKLRVAFGYLGVVANQSGLSLEEAGASTMVLADAGLRASTIGTSFRQVLSRMMDPPRLLRRELYRLGMSMDALNPSVVGFQTAMGNLVEVLTDQKTGAIDTSKAFDYFQLRGAQAAVIVAGAFRSGRWQEALDKLYEVGAASRMAATQMGGLQLKIENLVSRLKLMALAFGESGFASSMGLIIDSLRTIALIGEKVAGSSLLSIVVAIGSLSAAAATLVGVLQVLGKSLAWVFSGGISGWIVGLSKAHPVAMAMVAAVTALVAAYKALVVPIDQVIGKQQEQLVKNRDALSAMEQSITALEGYIKAQKEQNLSSREYSAFIQRLIEQVPDLKGKIDDNTSSIEKNIKVMKEQIRIRTDEALLQEFKSLDLYGKKLSQVSEKQKAWHTLLENSKSVFEFYGTPIKNLTTLFETLTFEIKELILGNGLLAVAFDKLGGTSFVDFAKGLLGIRDDITDFRDGLNTENKEINAILKDMDSTLESFVQNYAKKWDEKKAQDFLNLDKQGRIKLISDELYALGVGTKRVKKHMEAMLPLFAKQSGFIIADAQSTKEKQQVMDRLLEHYQMQTKMEEDLARIKKQRSTLEFAEANYFVGAFKERLVLLEKEYEINKALLDAEDEREYGEGQTKPEDIEKQKLDKLKKNLELTQKFEEDKRQIYLDEVKYASLLFDTAMQQSRAEADLAAAIAQTNDERKASEILIKQLQQEVALYNKYLDDTSNELQRTNLRDWHAEMMKAYSGLTSAQRSLSQETMNWVNAILQNDPKVLEAKETLRKKELEIAKAMSGDVGSVSKLDIEEKKKESRLAQIAVLEKQIAIVEQLRQAESARMSDGGNIAFDPTQLRAFDDMLLDLYTKSSKLQVRVQSMREYVRDSFADIGKSLVDNLGKGIAEAIVLSGDLKETFRNMAESILQDIIKIIAKMLIMKALWATIGKISGGGNFLKAIGIDELGSFSSLFKPGAASPAANMGTLTKQDFAALASVLSPSAIQRTPALAGAGQPSANYIININATDADSFARMLTSKSAQEMIAGTVTTKFVHNSPMRRTLNRGR